MVGLEAVCVPKWGWTKLKALEKCRLQTCCIHNCLGKLGHQACLMTGVTSLMSRTSSLSLSW